LCWPARCCCSNEWRLRKADANANPALAASYKVNAATVLLSSKGILADRKIGNMPEAEIAAWLKKAARSE
jgi:hypothetical protein